MEWFELTDLPQLRSIKFGGGFIDVHSIVFESSRMNTLMMQICLNYNPFNLVLVL